MRYQPQHEAHEDQPPSARRPAWRWLAVIFVTGFAVGAYANRPGPVKATVTRVQVVTRQVPTPVLSLACRRAMGQADASLADATALQAAFARHMSTMDQLARKPLTTRRALAMSSSMADAAVAADRYQQALDDYRAMTRACRGTPPPQAPTARRAPATGHAGMGPGDRPAGGASTGGPGGSSGTSGMGGVPGR